MPPSVYYQSTGIGIDRAEQGFESIVEPDDEGSGAEGFQILGHEAHPGFLPRTDENHSPQK